MGTACDCARQGVEFQPMVVESTGAWDKQAARVLWDITRGRRDAAWTPLAGALYRGEEPPCASRVGSPGRARDAG